MPLTIRPLTSADETAWRQLWRGYLDFYETELPEEVYASTFARLLGDDPADFSCLIAELDGTPVGLAHTLIHRHCWRVENVTYLQDLFVDPNARGKSVGRALIQAVYDAADKAEAPAVYWLTQEHNHTARALYDDIAELTPFVRYQR